MISLRDALYGVIVHSANDAAVVIAEAISGSEQAFAAKMTQTAMQLGMSNTVFRNASGLHNPTQVSTALDMAKLAIALRRDFPEFYPLFSKRSFIYKGAVINAHNMVLKRYRGADGLKTGYVTASGFNLVTSVTRPEGSIIGVVLGGPSVASRDNHMMALLDKGYSHLALNSHHAHKHQVAEAEVQEERSIDVFAASQIDEELEEELPAMVARAPARNIVVKRQHKVAPKAKVVGQKHVKVAAKINNKMVNKNKNRKRA
jgi:D-alanyl-D-alanine carboxypeptidase